MPIDRPSPFTPQWRVLLGSTFSFGNEFSQESAQQIEALRKELEQAKANDAQQAADLTQAAEVAAV